MIKGNKVELIPATLADRQKAYEWCFHSETTKSHSGPPDYPDTPILSFAEFCEKGYDEYYFTGARPAAGRGFLIAEGGEPVGFISYSSFHLKPPVSELDLWMSSEAHCGKGLGTDAILSLGEYLNETQGIAELIIAPSRRNTRAIRAYEKAGFRKTDKPMTDFLLEEYAFLYGEGDYGADETYIMVKQGPAASTGSRGEQN